MTQIDVYRNLFLQRPIVIKKIIYQITDTFFSANIIYVDTNEEKEYIQQIEYTLDEFRKYIHDGNVIAIELISDDGKYDIYSKYYYTTPRMGNYFKTINNKPMRFVVPVISIGVATTNDTFSQMKFVASVNASTVVEANVKVVDHPVGINPQYINLLPEIKCTADTATVSKDGSVDITITVYQDGKILNRPITVYPVARQGYINKTKVLVNGPTKIRFISLGLDPGDKPSIEVGFKHRSNLAHISFTVTE